MSEIQKNAKIDDLLKIDLLNNMMNFNEISWKIVIYDIKVTKNQGFTLSLENIILEKPQGSGNLPLQHLF